MKRNLLLILIIAVAFPTFAASDWHDDLVTNMNSENAVERALAVDRDPSSGKIRQATYRYTFKQKSLYKSLRSKLLNRENEASNFILKPGEDGQIIMKFVKPDNYRNYSLSHVNGKYQLIISVNTEPYDYVDSDSQKQFEERQKQFVERQKQFTERQKQFVERQRQYAERQAEKQRQYAEQQAEKQRQYAQQQAERQRQYAEQQAERQRQQAEKQRQYAEQQAERARLQAERARLQAERARQQAERQRLQINRSNSTSRIISTSASNSVESQNISSQLKAAEAERKRLLDNR
ncbi:MAG: hypothetical protein K2M11_00880 [Paramuribaculum sp.]|nr:hypothetical protein [Paramuribaculum sp.]